MLKTIILKRYKSSRVCRFLLSADVPLHIDLIERLHQRLLNRNIIIDIDELMESVVDKY